MVVAHTLAAPGRKDIEEMKEKNAEIAKLDKLCKKHQKAIERYREHIKADIFCEEDEKAYKETYKAWREQLDKISKAAGKPTTDSGEAIKDAADQEREKLRKQLQADAITPETEKQHEKKHHKNNGEQKDERIVKGVFVVTIFTDDIERETFIADRYKVANIPPRNIVEVQIERMGDIGYTTYSKLRGQDVVIVDFRSGKEVFEMHLEIEGLKPYAINQKKGKVVFKDKTISYCKKKTINEYEKDITGAYSYNARQQKDESLDNVYARLEHAIHALYLLGYVQQKDYIKLMNCSTSHFSTEWQEEWFKLQGQEAARNAKAEETENKAEKENGEKPEQAEGLTVETLANGHYLEQLKCRIIADAVKANVAIEAGRDQENAIVIGCLTAKAQIVQDMGNKLTIEIEESGRALKVKGIKLNGVPLYKEVEAADGR